MMLKFTESAVADSYFLFWTVISWLWDIICFSAGGVLCAFLLASLVVMWDELNVGNWLKSRYWLARGPKFHIGDSFWSGKYDDDSNLHTIVNTTFDRWNGFIYCSGEGFFIYESDLLKPKYEKAIIN
jgi:hypothetical protein